MRVIAGSAGGIPLKISSHDFRPTMDMVRGAIFSALGDLVIGARVLDLFAGSGAYGIEALSRGAAEAVFVDNQFRSIEAIRLNLARAKLDGKVVRDDAFRFLQKCKTSFRWCLPIPRMRNTPMIGTLLKSYWTAKLSSQPLNLPGSWSLSVRRLKEKQRPGSGRLRAKKNTEQPRYCSVSIRSPSVDAAISV